LEFFAVTTAPAQDDRVSKIIAAFQRAMDDAMISLGGQFEKNCFGQRVQ
jgi:hypothetical protein